MIPLSNSTLRNVRVLDLSECISGPYCTRLLGGFGADVIKVEEPALGDRSRRIGPFPNDAPDSERSALFLYLNTNKKSITLDIHHDIGLRVFRDLVRDTDVLVEDSMPGTMAKLGSGYDDLQEINPGLVMTSITGFGQTGPYSRYKATSIVSYAMGGQMFVCGQPDKEPLHSRSSQAEYNTGLHAFVGTMTALHERRRSGRGQHVDISTLECMVASHQFTLTWPAYSGAQLERPGWPGSVLPMTVYACEDGYVILRIMGIELAFLAELFEMPELLEDPRFEDLDARRRNLPALDAIVRENLAHLSKRAVFIACGEWGELGGFVATEGDLLEDPHYKERGFWAEVSHPKAGKHTYPGAPVIMTKSRWQMAPAPLLGEHNREIYCDRLNYAMEDLLKWQDAGII